MLRVSRTSFRPVLGTLARLYTLRTGRVISALLQMLEVVFAPREGGTANAAVVLHAVDFVEVFDVPLLVAVRFGAAPALAEVFGFECLLFVLHCKGDYTESYRCLRKGRWRWIQIGGYIGNLVASG